MGEHAQIPLWGRCSFVLWAAGSPTGSESKGYKQGFPSGGRGGREEGQKTRRGVACGLLEEGRMWSPFKKLDWGAWVAQSGKCLTSAQVMISQFEFEPHVGLCTDISEPAACLRFCVSLSVSVLPPLVLCFSIKSN